MQYFEIEMVHQQGWEAREDVLYCRPLVEPGDHVTAVQDGLPTWIYEMMVARPNLEEAIEYVQSIEAEIEPHIPITPKGSK